MMIKSKSNNEREWKSLNNSNITKKINPKTTFISNEFEKLKKGNHSFIQPILSLSPTKKICSKYYPSSSLSYKNNKNDPRNYYNINTLSTTSGSGNSTNSYNKKLDFNTNVFNRNSYNNKRQANLHHYQLNTKSSILHFQKEIGNEEAGTSPPSQGLPRSNPKVMKVYSTYTNNNRYRSHSIGWNIQSISIYLIISLYHHYQSNITINLTSLSIYHHHSIGLNDHYVLSEESNTIDRGDNEKDKLEFENNSTCFDLIKDIKKQINYLDIKKENNNQDILIDIENIDNLDENIYNNTSTSDNTESINKGNDEQMKEITDFQNTTGGLIQLLNNTVQILNNLNKDNDNLNNILKEKDIINKNQDDINNVNILKIKELFNQKKEILIDLEGKKYEIDQLHGDLNLKVIIIILITNEAITNIFIINLFNYLYYIYIYFKDYIYNEKQTSFSSGIKTVLQLKESEIKELKSNRSKLKSSLDLTTDCLEKTSISLTEQEDLNEQLEFELTHIKEQNLNLTDRISYLTANLMEFSNINDENKEISNLSCENCDKMKITIEKIKGDNDKLIEQNDSLATFILTGSRSVSPVKVTKNEIENIKLEIKSNQTTPVKPLEDIQIIDNDIDNLISFDQITNTNINVPIDGVIDKDIDRDTTTYNNYNQKDNVYSPSTNQQFSSSFAVSVSSIQFAQKLQNDNKSSINPLRVHHEKQLEQAVDVVKNTAWNNGTIYLCI
jgi:hypothetical protein